MSLLKTSKVAIITGASSNLGLNLGYRLIDELSPETNLTIIVTSRTLPRVQEAITNLKQYGQAKEPRRTGQLEFDYLLVDFTDMVSVLSAYYELTKHYKHIDYVFFNAVQAAFSGIDWMGALKETLTNPMQSVSNPTYKIQRVGLKSQDGMGLVFQGNIFGPYYFIHKIKPLLKNGGRIIWISSLMSGVDYLSFNDLQLIKSPLSYEGSKRMVDLMHFGTYKQLKSQDGIDQYLVQPGIFTSYSFLQYLNPFTYYGMLLLFYIARWCGSPYHNISGYKAAQAPIRCAILEEVQDSKVGSGCDRFGKEITRYDYVDDTGKEDVVKYLDILVKEWDEKLKDQILNSRQII